ncbi:hypothetical protein LOD99_13178 [Oopsacas minuta]|uniref:Wiskott-Aldrich syndrome protein family member n=1 Tax=Oopsacas minuta TaxID=111878 RepID=A0AAV7JB76_9METZ|nr:hypothetical protein LOD99_13178 [Oopsacas minuta]
MPVFNQIEPVYVSKEGVSDSLEQNAGHTLSKIILQLSNLSLIGSQLMESLLGEITNLNKRYYNIKNRIDTMNIKIDKLNPQSEHISPPTDDINIKRKSYQYKPVLLRNTLPPTLTDQYNRCENPPPFQQLFGQITSSESSERFKFYSNTDYFKESWYEKKKQDKIRKRILKNKLLRLQTTEIVNVFEQDDKFYPIPLHPMKPRVTTRKQLQTPPVTEPQIEEQSISQSDNDEISQYTSYQHDNVGSFDTYSRQDSFNYSEFDETSLHSKQQGSFYRDDSSVIYEVFESADLISTNSSDRLDKLSLGDTAVLMGQGNLNRSIEPNLSQTDSIDDYSETRSEIMEKRIIPVLERHDTNRRGSVVKDLLRSLVSERRRYITNESTSYSSQYSDESSTEYSESDGDD